MIVEIVVILQSKNTIVKKQNKLSMSFFSKYLIFIGIIGLVGIPIFVLNPSDLSWNCNKESYWGMIAMIAIIISQVALYLASKKENSTQQK